jgi:hypothetical protein
VVLFFVEKDDEATRDAIRGHNVSAVSKEKAVFILVVKPAEVAAPSAERRGPAVTSGGRRSADGEAGGESRSGSDATTSVSIVPASPFLAGDLWKAYDVKAAGTVVLADWFGNSKQTWARAPRESEVVRAIDGIAAIVDRDAKVLEGDLKRLEGYVEKDEHDRAVSQAVKMFRRNLAGHETIAKAAEHWTKLMDTGRKEIGSLESEGNVVALRGLRRTYRGTDIEPELNAAIERAAAAARR